MTANKSKPVIAVAAVAEASESERHVALQVRWLALKETQGHGNPNPVNCLFSKATH